MGPRAGFAGSVVLDFVRAAHGGIERDVEMEQRGHVLAVHRLVVHAHHVGELEAEQAVQHPGGAPQHLGQILPLLRGELGDIRPVGVAHDVHAVRVFAEEGEEHREMFGAENHPPPVGHLRVQHVAEQAAALLLLVRPGVFPLQLQLLGQEGVAVNLAVGMGPRPPGSRR